MSEEQLMAFIAKAKDDQSIQDKLKAAKTPEDVVGIAKEHGHEFATEHMIQLSEEELERVAGGTDTGFLDPFNPLQSQKTADDVANLPSNSLQFQAVIISSTTSKSPQISLQYLARLFAVTNK